jgi:hypothetical protein
MKTPKPQKNKEGDITPAKKVIPLRKIKGLKLADGLNKQAIIGKIPQSSPIKMINQNSSEKKAGKRPKMQVPETLYGLDINLIKNIDQIEGT